MGLLTIRKPGAESSEAEHKWFHRFLNLQLAHDGVMIDDAQKNLSLQRAVAAAHAKKTNGADLPPESDDMVHIGDQVTNQYPQAASKAGGLLKAALAAGLIATGAGAGIGIPLLLNAMKPAAPAVDLNSLFDLDIVNPDKEEAPPAPVP